MFSLDQDTIYKVALVVAPLALVFIQARGWKVPLVEGFLTWLIAQPKPQPKPAPVVEAQAFAPPRNYVADAAFGVVSEELGEKASNGFNVEAKDKTIVLTLNTK